MEDAWRLVLSGQPAMYEVAAICLVPLYSFGKSLIGSIGDDGRAGPKRYGCDQQHRDHYRDRRPVARLRAKTEMTQPD